MSDQYIGDRLTNGQRMTFSQECELLIDSQNQVDIAVIRTCSGTEAEILPAAHALELMRFDGGYRLKFKNELLDVNSLYHVAVFTSQAGIGDVLLTLQSPKSHYPSPSPGQGCVTMCNVYYKKDEWKIRIGGDYYPGGVAEFLRLHGSST